MSTTDAQQGTPTPIAYYDPVSKRVCYPDEVTPRKALPPLKDPSRYSVALYSAPDLAALTQRLKEAEGLLGEAVVLVDGFRKLAARIEGTKLNDLLVIHGIQDRIRTFLSPTDNKEGGK